MRIIDKTPYLAEDGSISLVNRIQGTLQHGFSWYGNIQAQAKAVAFFEKQLDKKFTLIRNHTLDRSKITIPFILIGPPGIYVFIITDLDGTYQAKGNNWGKIDGEKYKEAGINLLKRTTQYSKAVDLYLKKQGFELPKPSNPILMALNPGIHIETIRPIVRVVMSDALDRFAVELRQSPPIMVVGDVHQVSEALTTPIRKQNSAPTAKLQAAPSQADDRHDGIQPQNAKTTDNPDFSFDDSKNQQHETPSTEKENPRPVIKRPRKKKKKNGIFGMTNKQLMIIAVMAAIVAILLVAVIIAALFTL